MESLIVFIIFIVFSIIRSLGGNGHRQPHRGPVAPPPFGRPIRPGSPGRVGESKPVAVPASRSPLDIPDLYNYSAETVSTPAAGKRQKERLAGQRETGREKPADHAVKRVKQPTVQFDEDAVVMGVIYAEILGPPRAKRPYGRR